MQDLDPSVIESRLSDPDTRQAFADRLVTMATSESLHLLNTFANMAHARPEVETNFVTLVATEIFDVSHPLSDFKINK